MARADKDDGFRELRDAALEQGWRVEEAQTRWKFIPPTRDVTPVFFSSSMGDWRSIRNFISAMRQRGFISPRGFRKANG